MYQNRLELECIDEFKLGRTDILCFLLFSIMNVQYIILIV